MRVGTAGWSYPDWEGRVYPRHKPRGFHALAFLSTFIDCVEVNSTFYAQPRPQNARRWCELVSSRPDFRFTVKLLRDFTHARPPEDDETWEREAAIFRAGIEPLVRARRLSAILVQFPVSFDFQPERVKHLGRLHSLFGSVPLVLEVRHHSWFTPPGLDTVRGLSYSLAYLDMPSAWNHPPDWHAPTGGVGYLRLHGRNKDEWFRSSSRDARYDYLYGPGELGALADKARRIETENEESFVIANNHFAGKALANALELIHRLRGGEVHAPPELLQSFPHLKAFAKIEGQGEFFD